MKKEAAIIFIFSFFILGATIVYALYNFNPNPGHGGEDGVWVENTNGIEKYLQTAIDDGDLSELDCDGTTIFNGYSTTPSNLVGHTSDQILVNIEGVTTTLQNAVSNQLLAKSDSSCSPLSITPVNPSTLPVFHPASQIRIRNPSGTEKYLQTAIDDGDFFDKCGCASQVSSIWVGWRSSTPSKQSRLLKIDSDGNLLEQYTICKNPTTGIYSSISGTNTISTCPGISSGFARFGVGWEDPEATNLAHSGYVAYNSDDKEVWFIIGKGVAHFIEGSNTPSLTLKKYCTQPNGIYSVTLDAAGDAWITTQKTDNNIKYLEIYKLSKDDSACNFQNIVLANSDNQMSNINQPDNGVMVRLALTQNGDIWTSFTRNDGFTPRLFYIKNILTNPIYDDLTQYLYNDNLVNQRGLIADSQGNAYLSLTVTSSKFVVVKYDSTSSHTKTEILSNPLSQSAFYDFALNSENEVWVAKTGLTKINPPLNINPPTILCTTASPPLRQVGIDKSGNVWGIASNGICIYNSVGSNQQCFCNPLGFGTIVGTGDFTGMNRKVSLG